MGLLLVLLEGTKGILLSRTQVGIIIMLPKCTVPWGFVTARGTVV